MFFGKQKKTGDFDLIVIGGGSGAFAAAIRAADLGARVGIFEGDTIGGTCVNRGCLPTKNLLHAAEIYHEYRSNGFPGLPKGESPANFGEIIRQKDELVEAMRKAKYTDILEAYPTVQFILHKARFVSQNAIEAGGRQYSSDRFILATGASPSTPPIEGIGRISLLTYKEAINLQQLPASLVVIGGGPIGLELGQMFARFGTRVTVLEALPRIAPTEEPEISEALKRYLSEEMEIHTGVKVKRLDQDGKTVVVKGELEGRDAVFQGEKLLVATGLRPNTADLNLEAPGVRTAPNGAVQVNDEMRTSAKYIWAVGDVTGNPMLVTVAAYTGGLAAENALKGSHLKVDYRSVPHAIFTTPQAAGVGVKEDEARQKGIKVECKSLSFEHVPKAGAVRDTRGLIKLVADASTFRILGVHIVSAAAADLIHIGVLAVRHNLTVGDLIRSVFVYPTLAEAYKMAALSYKKDVSKLSCCAG